MEKPIIKHKVSPYTLKHQDSKGGVWLTNVLHGQWLYLLEDEWRTIIDKGIETKTRKLLLERLIDACIIEADKFIDEKFYSAIIKTILHNKVYRFGFLLDYLQSNEINLTPLYAKNYLNTVSDHPEKIFIHSWFFTDNGRKRLKNFTDAIAQFPIDNCDLYVALCTDGSQSLEEELTSIAKLKKYMRSGIVVFVLTKEAAMAAGGSSKYCMRIFEQQGQLYNLGFFPHFLFRCTPETFHFMQGELFETLCFSGIYPRNLYFSFSNKFEHILELTCELYYWNWDLYRKIGKFLALSPKHQVFEPMSRGIADKLRALFRDNTEIPIAQYCPFGHHSLIFGIQGTVTSCPVSQKNLITSNSLSPELNIGNLLTGELNYETQKKWDTRSPITINKCNKCCIAPICGSGCPLAALEDFEDLYQPSCPPAATVLRQEIEVANERLL